MSDTHTYIELNEEGNIKFIGGSFKAKDIKKYFKELQDNIKGNGSREKTIRRD